MNRSIRRRRTRSRPRRVVPIGVLTVTACIPAVGLGGLWRFAESRAGTDEPPATDTPGDDVGTTGRLATPLLSYRRQPDLLAERAAAAAARSAFLAEVDRLSALVGTGSCLHLRLGPETVVDLGAGIPVIPASNQKLMVAAVALEVLGSEFRFRTEVRSAAPVGGVVPGNVVLVGGGDPVLVSDGVIDPLRHPAFNTTRFDDLVDAVVAAGVTRIDGDVVGDGSRYDDEFRVPSWGAEITNLDGGPYDALLVDDGIIENGNYGRVPARSAAVVFENLLESRGVTVVGGTDQIDGAATGLPTTLASVESEALPEILVEMLHTSDNNTAEMILKEIGFQVAGVGSRQAGLDVVGARLAEWGMPLDGFALADGSGLSRENRATCAGIAWLLADSPVATDLVDLLAVVGRDGTLAQQLLGSPAEARMQAKTGTLTDVKALSGTMPGHDGDPFTFSLLLNRAGADETASFRPVWEDLAHLIDSYPVEVDLDVGGFGPLHTDDAAVDEAGDGGVP